MEESKKKKKKKKTLKVSPGAAKYPRWGEGGGRGEGGGKPPEAEAFFFKSKV